MTWFSIFAIIAPIILITAFIYFKKKRRMIVSIAILCLSYLVFEFYKWMDEPDYGFNYTHLVVEDKTSDFTLSLIENVLYESSLNEPIGYKLRDWGSDTLDYKPIYLKTLNTKYDLVIFSRNPDKQVPYGYYTHDDYEFNADTQSVIILVEKRTGKLLKVHSYDLIGYTLDLNNILVQDQTVAMPVFKPYTNEVSYYFTLYIEDTDNLVSIFDTYLFLNLNSKLKYYAFGNEFHLGVFEDGTVKYQSFETNRTFEYYNGEPRIVSSGYSTKHLYSLADELYVKQGYFTVVNRLLYVVKNDLKIYRMNGNDSTYIADVIDLNLWHTQIPQ